jgi:hypothetical protein
MLDRTRRVSHYIRLMKLEHDFYYKTNLRYVLRVHVTDLIFNCNPYDINMRRARGRSSSITKKSETRFILTRH